MSKLTISSPGVQIAEVDLSLETQENAINTVFIAGFAPTGPINEPITVGSLSEYTQIFGLPTNGAERYFYQTVAAAFQGSSTIIVSRVPYGSGAGVTVSNQYSLLAYPVSAYDANNSIGTTNLSITSGAYIVGSPLHFTLTSTDYQNYIANGITWNSNVSTNGIAGQVNLTSTLSSIANAGIIIVNESQTIIDPQYQGFYVGLIDNTNNLPTTAFDCINTVNTLLAQDTFGTIPAARLNFSLSANNPGPAGSISQVLESGIPTFDISQRPYVDTITLGLFKIRQSVFSTDANVLDYVLTESYVGSLDSTRLINNPNGGPAVSFDIQKITAGSNNIQVLVNPAISHRLTNKSWCDANGLPQIQVTINPDMNSGGALNALGVYQPLNITTSLIGNLPAKITSALTNVSDPDVYPLTIVCEAGLGSVYANSMNVAGSSPTVGGIYFDDYNTPVSTTDSLFTQMDGTPPSTSTLWQNYQAVLTQFENFVLDPARRDHIVICDPLVNILIQNNNTKTVNVLGNNFTQNLYWPLRNLYAGTNTSYLVSYPTFVQVADNNSSANVWVPFSGFAAAAMTNTNYPWDAPAGFTRGVVSNVIDIAYYPTQKQRDQLYNINQNPVAFFPSDGFVIYGQKTMQRKPSAFDRINVRRLFCYLERNTRNTVKYFVFEPNTLYTRTQVINTLSPIFNEAQNTSGIYQYLIICDERNNSADVIDANELVVDIYIKPVRTAEFILVNFYAMSTGASFTEITS